MKDVEIFDGYLENLERLPSSANGNPRYTCHIDGVRVRTAPDSMLAYALPNYRGALVRATVRWYYGYRTIVTIDRRA